MTRYRHEPRMEYIDQNVKENIQRQKKNKKPNEQFLYIRT